MPQWKNSTSAFPKNSIHEVLSPKLDTHSSSWSHLLFTKDNIAIMALRIQVYISQVDRARAFVLVQLCKHLLTFHIPQVYVRLNLSNPRTAVSQGIFQEVSPVGGKHPVPAGPSPWCWARQRWHRRTWCCLGSPHTAKSAGAWLVGQVILS